MRFACGISDAVQLAVASTATAEQVGRDLGGLSCHLACLFVSPVYATDLSVAVRRVHEVLKPGILIGCSAAGVIGGEQEVEWMPAVSLVGAHLPGVRLLPFSVSPTDLAGSRPRRYWAEKIGVEPDASPVFILLADAYTCDPSQLLGELNAAYPGCRIIGGLASGGNQPGEHRLFYDTELATDGAVGLAMTGNICLETVIAQGCRSIGRPVVITKAEGNVIWELGSRPALEVLRQVLRGLSPPDQELAQKSVMLGLVVDEMKATFQAGDFVIRSLVGIDPPSGAMAISEDVAVGKTVQFHLRDPQASRQDLRRLLAEQLKAANGGPPAGALVFNCLDRGKSFYVSAHQDLRALRMVHQALPVGGFFCNGEIAPVGRTNVLHGYTASVGLFRPAASLRTSEAGGPG